MIQHCCLIIVAYVFLLFVIEFYSWYGKHITIRSLICGNYVDFHYNDIKLTDFVLLGAIDKVKYAYDCVSPCMFTAHCSHFSLSGWTCKLSEIKR